MRTDVQTRKVNVPSRGNARLAIADYSDSHELVLPERKPDDTITLAPRLFIPLRSEKMNTSAGLIDTELEVATLGTIEIESHKRKLALLLPGHNEELIIAATIDSAIASGQPAEDIYVVDDNSSDATREIAISKLGNHNVLSVQRSGKALAVKQAIDNFDLESRYYWLHVADADSIFSPNYFREYVLKLDETRYAVAVGFVQSLRGNWISTYRAYTYTYGQQIARRVHAKLGMIPVFPGPTTCFRTDILKDLEFGNSSLTEDFDITLQVHRKNLGSVVYIPKAINYTQDPQTLSDFCKQNFRWKRGFFQGVLKHHIGIKAQRIDLSIGFQLLQNMGFIAQIFLWLPFYIAFTGNWAIIPALIALDIIINSAMIIFSSFASKRWMLIGMLPYFYFLFWIEMAIHYIAFVEVVVLGKFRDEVIGWSTAGRRYKLSNQALVDIK